MAERLKLLQAQADASQHQFLNDQRAKMFYRQVAEAKTDADRTLNWIRYAYEEIHAGNLSAGIDALLQIREASNQPGKALKGPALRKISELLALAYFRKGEQDNCIVRHSVDSCLMPIQGSGVHTLPQGARAALHEWMSMLAETPDDLEVRWLVNLAHMTLGEYPDKVPQQYLIPPKVFESEFMIPRFYDVASQCGLAKVGHAGGCVTEDLNGDGYIDVMSSSWDLQDPVHYFQNNADGTFSDRTAEAGLTGITGGLNLSHADYDNDGDFDVLILRGAWLFESGRHPNSLLRNNGDGTFEDVTEAAGLLSFHPTQAGTWADYDNDGWVDLFIGNESSETGAHPCELYHNNGNGTFTNVAAQSGVAFLGYVKGAAWGDVNNDGLQDLYLSMLDQPNVLFLNEGCISGIDGKGSCHFRDVTRQAGVGLPVQSFPTWFWDYDNDGWLDLFVASYPTIGKGRLLSIVQDYLGLPYDMETARLFHNNGAAGQAGFSDVTKATGFDHMILAMGANYGDLDNDGWLDAYFGTGEPSLTILVPNRMFRNHEGRQFQDVTTAGGFGHLQKGHGVAFADFDNDGDQDIYAVMGGAFLDDTFQSALFENPGFGNQWIALVLEGVRSNRAAIGTRIKVNVETPQGTRPIHAVVTSGGSFGSASFQQEIGLGQATRIESLEITWPASGIRQKFTDVPMNKFLHIRETDLVPTALSRQVYDLSPKGHDEAPCPQHAAGEPDKSRSSQ